MTLLPYVKVEVCILNKCLLVCKCIYHSIWVMWVIIPSKKQGHRCRYKLQKLSSENSVTYICEVLLKTAPVAPAALADVAQ